MWWKCLLLVLAFYIIMNYLVFKFGGPIPEDGDLHNFMPKRAPKRRIKQEEPHG